MNTRNTRSMGWGSFLLLSAPLLVLAACGGSGGDSSDSVEAPAEGGRGGDSIAPVSVGNGAVAGQSSGMPSTATVFREHHITDPGMNNMVASTVLVPKGWEVEGGITRPGDRYYSMPVLLDIKFAAPDGRQLRHFPSFAFEFSNQQQGQPLAPTLDGNMYMPLPDSPGSWLMEMATTSPDPSVRGLRLVSETMEPELTQQLRQQNAQLYQMVDQNRSLAMQTGFGMEFDTQATVLIIEYEYNGSPMQETILMAWQYLINTWQGQVSGGTWRINSMYSLRGPAGSNYLNDPELMTILQSSRPNPAWEREMNSYWTELARIRSRGAAERSAHANAAHQKRMQTMNETSDIISNGWSARVAMQDAGHQRYIDAIHEVTPYQTPSGETVRLPSFYDHVYTDSNGNYILNNDSFYEPNRDPSVNNVSWQRIDQSR